MTTKTKTTRKPRAKKTDDSKPVSRSVIPALYKKTHVMSKLSDTISATVRGGDLNDPVDPKLFSALCRANKIDPARWAHLNIGMQIMNFCNVMRNRADDGEDVVTTLAPRKARTQKETAKAA